MIVAEARRQRALAERRRAMAERCYLTARELARRWSCSVQTVYDADVPCFRLGPPPPAGQKDRRPCRYHPDVVLEYEQTRTICGST